MASEAPLEQGHEARSSAGCGRPRHWRHRPRHQHSDRGCSGSPLEAAPGCVRDAPWLSPTVSPCIIDWDTRVALAVEDLSWAVVVSVIGEEPLASAGDMVAELAPCLGFDAVL